LAFFDGTTGFALVVPEKSLGTRLAHDSAGRADEEAVFGMRVTKVSRPSTRSLESFSTNAALKWGDVTIDAPVLISGCCGGGGDGGGCSGGSGDRGRSGGSGDGGGCSGGGGDRGGCGSRSRCGGGGCGQALPRDRFALPDGGAGFAVSIPHHPLGAGLTHDGTGRADEEAVFRVRVTEIS